VAARKLLGNDRLFHDLTESTLRFQWETIRTKLGMTDDEQFVVHMLRHTCASRLAMAGKNATFIMNWMGHSSIMVTQRYMHLSPNTMLEGAEALENYRTPKLVQIGGR
jgi:integrase